MTTRSLSAIAVLVAFAACTDSPSRPSSLISSMPVPQSVPAPATSRTNGANWSADALVVAGADHGGACGWGTKTGDTRSGVLWKIEITGSSILLDEDMPNWPTDDVPYKGTLVDRQFAATYASGEDYVKYVCQFKGGVLSGSFSPDRTSFEADETLTWGPPDNERVVRRHWTARLL